MLRGPGAGTGLFSAGTRCPQSAVGHAGTPPYYSVGVGGFPHPHHHGHAVTTTGARSHTSSDQWEQ